MNRYNAHGYLAADPELGQFSDGTAVINFSVGVTTRWKNKQTNEQQEKTEWPRFVATGRMAEVINQYCKKGSEVLITDSEMRQRSYQHKDGYKVWVTEFYIRQRGFEFCGKGNATNNDPRTQQQQQQASSPENFDDVPF